MEENKYNNFVLINNWLIMEKINKYGNNVLKKLTNTMLNEFMLFVKLLIRVKNAIGIKI